MNVFPTDTQEHLPSVRLKRHWMRWVIYGSLAGTLFILIGVARQMNASTDPATRLGVSNGQLASCPDSPNCVSTQAQDDSHRMDTLPWRGSTEEAMERLQQVIQSFPRTQIVTRTDDYLHIEFRSLIFRFIDDVEFWVNPAEEVIHFRSASRIGYSDLGANRKRMNAFVSRFNELNGGAP